MKSTSKGARRGPSKQISLSIPKNMPAFAGQVVEQFHLNITPVVLSTTVTTGVIAIPLVINAAAVPNFTSRFNNLFEEYRIVMASMDVKCFSSTNPGLFTHWFDEKDSSTPTAAEAQRISLKSFSASSPMSHKITWRARDPLDLQYTSIATSVSPVTYKVYTDLANFGSSGVATPYAQLTGSVWIQFRGLQ